MTSIPPSRACVSFLLLAGVMTADVFGAASSTASRPNVIVFLVDDMGVMDTSLPFLTDDQGHPKTYPLNEYYRTPNMERLAKQGIRFNNFYAMSVCSPTRVSILTGQNAARHHTTNWISPEKNNAGPLGPPDWNWQGLGTDSTTLPQLLRQAGYRTIHVGKAHFGPNDSEGAEPLNFGFDINVAGRSIGAPGSYFGKDNYGNLSTKRKDRAVPHLEKYHGTDTHLSEALTIEALDHVRQAVAADKPFFLYLAHYAVHSPHQSDPRFADHYQESNKPARAQAFATLIEGMDKSLGDVLDRVQELGVGTNTLVLFLGDNGSDAPLGHEHAVACAAPLRGKKGSHYEGGVRVPLIAAWVSPSPSTAVQQRVAILAGAIQPQMANVCDLLPTIGEVAGVELPGDHPVDGQSLTQLLTGAADANHSNEFLMHYPHSPHRSTYFTTLRHGDWKVAYHYYPSEDSEGQRYQLFHLAEDPFEQTNLAEKHPGRLRAMMERLTSSLRKHDALYVVDARDALQRLEPEIPAGR